MKLIKYLYFIVKSYKAWIISTCYFDSYFGGLIKQRVAQKQYFEIFVRLFGKYFLESSDLEIQVSKVKEIERMHSRLKKLKNETAERIE
jgi:hypothetical protein